MARVKKSVTTAEEGIQQIMSVEPLKTIAEGAEFVGLSVLGLQELFSRELNSAEPMGWEVIPQEYEHLLNAFKAEVTEIQAEAPEVLPEAPVLEEPAVKEPEAPKPKKRRGKGGALTQKKEEAIADTKQQTQETGKGISESMTLLQAQEAVVDSSQDASAYLSTYVANLTNLKGEGLTYLASQTLQKIAQSSGFNPQDIMQQVGVPLSADTQAKLNETMGHVLGKSQAAMNVIRETTWENGYNLQLDLSQLENLMNSED